MQAPRMHPLAPHPSTHHRSNSLTVPTPASSLRRAPAAGGPERPYEKHITNPWEDMTYTWVAEQDYNIGMKQQGKHGRKTEEWVFKQAYFFPREDEHPITPITLTRSHHLQGHHHRSGSLRRDPAGGVPHAPRPPPPPPPRRTQPEWEDVIYRYEVDAERWMRHEEESRRLAEERLRARTRMEDELRRIDDRIRHRKEEQRRLFEESRTRSMPSSGGSGLREHERKERARLEKAVADGWEKYESRWSEISSSSEPLTFANIPWPMAVVPRTVEDISASAISSFLLSGVHSQQISKKERIRSAQLRWHPDRFRRLMGRVSEKDKATVEEGVGSVARVLNDLMQREKRTSK